MRKSIAFFSVICAVIIFLSGNVIAYDLLTIETPTARQIFESSLIDVKVVFEPEADPETFSAKLNGQDITNQFSSTTNGKIAVLGSEDGLKIFEIGSRGAFKGHGRNVLKVKVKGDKFKTGVDQKIFFIRVHPEKIVRGVVAAGAPIIGNVYVKDFSVTPNIIGPVLIDIDGTFEVDITGLTPPIYLKAEGVVNNTSYTLFSTISETGGAATATANINPLTSLVIATAAGVNDPTLVWDSPQVYPLDQDSLDQAVIDVQTFIEQLMVANNCVGVNFITDTYAANHQGVDGILDSVGIAIDPVTNDVTITDKIVNVVIGVSNISSMVEPSDLITQEEAEWSIDIPDFLASLEDENYPYLRVIKREGCLIEAMHIEPFYAANFGILDGHNRTQRISELVEWLRTICSIGKPYTSFSNVTLQGVTDEGYLIVNYYINYFDGTQNPITSLFVKEDDGIYRFVGNGYSTWVGVSSESVKIIGWDGSKVFRSGVAFWIIDPPGPDDLINVLVEGPGLPAQGLTFTRNYNVPDHEHGASGYSMPGAYQDPILQSLREFLFVLSDEKIAVIPDNAEYTFTIMDSNGNTHEVRTSRLLKPPATSSILVDDHFPTFSLDLPESHNTLLDNFGGTTTFSYAKPTDPNLLTNWLRMYAYYLGPDVFEGNLKPLSMFSDTGSVTSEGNGVFSTWSVFAFVARDQYFRNFRNSWVNNSTGLFVSLDNMPKRNIFVDGDSSDWSHVDGIPDPIIITDHEDDSSCGIGTDITALYLAVDQTHENLFWRLDTKSGTYKFRETIDQTDHYSPFLWTGKWLQAPVNNWDLTLQSQIFSSGTAMTVINGDWANPEIVDQEHIKLGVILEGRIPLNLLPDNFLINYLEASYWNLYSSDRCDQIR